MFKINVLSVLPDDLLSIMSENKKKKILFIIFIMNQNFVILSEGMECTAWHMTAASWKCHGKQWYQEAGVNVLDKMV